MARPPWRIRDRATFDRLRRSSVRARRGPLSVTWTPPVAVAQAEAGAEVPRVAFAIGRRVGSAVARNRLRRRLRAALAELELAPGSYLVSAGSEAVHLSPTELRSTLHAAMADVGSRS